MDKKEHIKIYGTSWCGATQRVVSFLNSRKISFDFIDIDNDRKGEEFVKKANNSYRSVPTIVLSNGSILVEPSEIELSKYLIND